MTCRATARRAVVLVGVGATLALGGCAFVVEDRTPTGTAAPTSVGTTVAPVPLGSPDPGTPTAPTPWVAPTYEPALDADGRPYDVPLEEGVVVTTERIGSIDLHGERLVLDGGEGYFRGSDLPVVPLPRVEAVDVELVLASLSPTVYEVAGVVLRVPGGRVDRWTAFEDGYGTDGGMGAVWVPGVADLTDVGPEFGMPRPAEAALVRLIDGTQWDLTDVDADGDADGLLFGNSWGDGGFPMTRGLDRDGEVAAVAIWHVTSPWRLGVPDGTPPPDVVEAEDAVVECLARGGRPRLDDTCTR